MGQSSSSSFTQTPTASTLIVTNIESSHEGRSVESVVSSPQKGTLPEGEFGEDSSETWSES